MGSAASGRRVSLELVQRAERLLAGGWPRRRVAAELGLDKATVRQIAAGEHATQRRLKRLVRCPGCGGLVELPCRKCATDRGEVLPDGTIQEAA